MIEIRQLTKVFKLSKKQMAKGQDRNLDWQVNV